MVPVLTLQWTGDFEECDDGEEKARGQEPGQAKPIAKTALARRVGRDGERVLVGSWIHAGIFARNVPICWITC